MKTYTPEQEARQQAAAKDLLDYLMTMKTPKPTKRIIALGCMKGKAKPKMTALLKGLILNCLMLGGCSPLYNSGNLPEWVNIQNLIRGGMFGLACVLIAVLLGILAAYIMES